MCCYLHLPPTYLLILIALVDQICLLPVYCLAKVQVHRQCNSGLLPIYAQQLHASSLVAWLTKLILALGAQYVGDQSSTERETPPSSTTISKGTSPQSSQKASGCAIMLASASPHSSQQPSATAMNTWLKEEEVIQLV